MKKAILIIHFILLTIVSYAIPAQRRTFTVTQKDGSTLTLIMVGDECFHYYVNVNTEEKMLKGEDGDYYVMSDEEFAERSAAGNERRSKANEQRVQRLIKRRATTDSNGRRRIGALSNSIEGNKKGLVILVNFSDKSMTEEHNQEVFSDMFNKEGYNENGHVGSVHDYFYDQSYGKFNLTFDVVGPVTLSQSMSYYGGNDSKGNDLRPRSMVIEACQLADSLGVNFGDYDWQGDGTVDQVFIIFAGYGENYSNADPNTIWPHEWSLASPLPLDGVKISTYACTAELCGTSGTTLCGIGTACHEFSHCLGYPDFYDTDYSGGIGMGYYDIMDEGNYNGPHFNGEVPVGFTAYERAMAGWLTPIELTETTSITDMPPLNDSPTAYIIYNQGNSNECLMLENRKADKWFHYFMYGDCGHGLFITHIDEDATIWKNNRPNDDPSHQRMTWVAADNSYGTYNSTTMRWRYTRSEVAGDFFPGLANVTALSNTSHLNVGGKMFNRNSDESYYINHTLSEITENSETSTISFLFDSSLFTVTFNPCNGTCNVNNWTQSSFMEGTELPIAESADEGWEFAGWSTTPMMEIGEQAPSFVDVKDGKYAPIEDVTLFAVYKQVGSEETGEFTLSMKVNENTMYVGEVNSSNNGFTTSAENATIFNYEDGNLSFTYNGETNYVLSCVDEKEAFDSPDLRFSTTKPSKATWTLTEDGEDVIFTLVPKVEDKTRYFARWGENVKAYTNYNTMPHTWTRSYLSQRSLASNTSYTSYPTADISLLVKLIDQLQQSGKGYTPSDIERLVNRLLQP